MKKKQDLELQFPFDLLKCQNVDMLKTKYRSFISNMKYEKYLKFYISHQSNDDFEVACKLIENYQKEKTLIIHNKKFTNSKHEFLMHKNDEYFHENYEENANKKRNAITLTKELIEELSDSLLKGFSYTKNLEILEISGINFGDKAWKNFHTAISKCNSIKRLYLIGIGLNESCCQSFVSLFTNSNNIEHLDLSHNKIREEWGYYFKKIICAQNELRNNIIWAFGLRNEIPESKESKSGLLSLYFEYTSINDRFLNYISDALLFDSYICSLSFKGNRITPETINNFFKNVKENDILVNIDFDQNPGFNEFLKAKESDFTLQNIYNLKRKDPKKFLYFLKNKYIQNPSIQLIKTPINIITSDSKIFGQTEISKREKQKQNKNIRENNDLSPLKSNFIILKNKKDVAKILGNQNQNVFTKKEKQANSSFRMPKKRSINFNININKPEKNQDNKIKINILKNEKDINKLNYDLICNPKDKKLKQIAFENQKNSNLNLGNKIFIHKPQASDLKSNDNFLRSNSNYCEIQNKSAFTRSKSSLYQGHSISTGNGGDNLHNVYNRTKPIGYSNLNIKKKV